jgi:biotin carboxylase
MSSEPVVIYLNLRRTALEHGAALEAAHRRGYGVALIADTVPADLPADIVRVVHHLDTYDVAAVHRAVDEIAAQYTVAGVVTWSDRDVETVSLIAERLGLTAAPIAAAEIARNKYLMREALSSHPETIPAYARVTTEEELFAAAHEIGYPAVLKPTSASGSKGIFIVHDGEQLRTAFGELMRYTRPDVDKVFTSNPNELIYEEFLAGTEHSVEGFVFDGETVIAGVTDKETTEPFRLELGHLHPSTLSPDALSAIENLTVTVVKALGLDNCAFHLECMAAPDGSVKLVEVAARVGGDFITSHLIPLATGVSFYENVIRVAVGERPLPHSGQRRYAGLRKLMAEREGVLRAVDGISAAEQVSGVRHIVRERPIGAEIRLPPADYMSSTLGAVIAVGDSPAAVRRTLRQATGVLRPRIGAADPS